VMRVPYDEHPNCCNPNIEPDHLYRFRYVVQFFEFNST